MREKGPLGYSSLRSLSHSSFVSLTLCYFPNILSPSPQTRGCRLFILPISPPIFLFSGTNKKAEEWKE